MAAIPNLALITGPIEVGTIASSFLTGCLAIQTYVYYSRFSSDPVILKIFIAGLCITGLTHLLCVAVALWQNTISEPTSLYVLPYSGDMVIALTLVVSFAAELFFIFRLLKLSRGMLLPLICLSISIIFATSGTVVIVNAFLMTSVVQFVNSQFVTITLTLIAGATCDFAITLGLIYHLFKLRKPHFPSTSRIIDTLILWTIESGLTPSLCGIIAVICFVLMRDNFSVVWMGVYEVLASVRVNALLATRSIIRSKRYTGEVLELNPRIRAHHDARIPRHPSIVINITRSTELMVDDEDKDHIQENSRFNDSSVSV
ncbi:hypothetical protein BJ138DRAFT_1102487 [Hygrophoropsis aurantiaca]|uniref:Uncharacterized protein n=1 Tax=Hygrophoropsis aurantiaca TaxID=72124 RepID=A0ACB8A8F5_9AGAM|nr:hypothetical protein BJ138DRAFT_1102487 [Hygrophoropsis aurantiaca]